MELFQNLLSTAGFVPRALCGQWTPQLIWLHKGSDLLIWSAYVAIPVVLVSFAMRRRRDIPFRSVFLLFGLFIVACGTTHLMEYIMFTMPLYRLAGLVKLVTAIASWATVLALIPVLPRALAMRSPEELEREIVTRTGELQEANRQKDELLQRAQAARDEAELARQHEEAARQQEEAARRLAEVARVEAETANRAKDEFLNTLSHELRTPLNAILGWTTLIRSGRLDPAIAAQAMESIERNAHIQARLTEDLLDVSRINEGKLRLELEALDLASVVNAALESVRPTAETKDVLLYTDITSDTCWVSGDATRLQQVVWNLLTNAIKFTPKNGRVDVQLQCSHSVAEIMVRDNGIGIEADILPHIFERFRQADSSTTRHYGGLGLGLSIVRSVVEMHGGQVKAESEGPQRGAIFTVSLPLLAMRPASLTPLAPHNSEDGHPIQSTFSGTFQSTLMPPAETKNALRALKILVVDDELDARELVATTLKQHEAQVQTVDSAARALQMAREWKPQLLISDIGMPEMDGHALIKVLRADAALSSLPAIALTAYARTLDRQRALEAGFDAHLAKPINPHLLLSAILQLAPRDAEEDGGSETGAQVL